MELQKHRLTVGQMARLHDINKRTLHYYDEIGLFSPKLKGENGYRYYTMDQMADLELILAFRELGMSIEETQAAIHCSAGTVNDILKDKIKDIDGKIQHLRSMKKLLEARQKLSALSKDLPLGKIETIFCEEEYFLLSNKIVGTEDENYFLAMGELLNRERRYRLFNHDYGIMISAEKIMDGQFNDYDRFYMKPSSAVQKNLFKRPAGNYLRIAVKGDWTQLPGAYRNLLEYAQEHHIRFEGYSYERGLNETLSSNMDEYITEILIKWTEDIDL